MSSNYIAEFPEDISNVLANNQMYDSPELIAAGNGLARLFGGRSMDELPPTYREFLHKILYAVANSYGDTLGLMNVGNMFMNMQQAVMAGTRGGGGGYSSLPSSLLGVTPGSSLQLMQKANLLTSLAKQFYFNDDGTVNLDNTQGMSSEVFSAFAADAARFVPQRVQNPVRVTAQVDKGSGIEGIEKAYKELQDKGGVLTYSQTEFLSQLKRYKELRKGKGDWKKKLDEELTGIDRELDGTPVEGEDGIQDSALLQKIERIKDKLGKRAEGAKTIGDLRKIIEETDKLREGGVYKTEDGQTITYTREDIERLERIGKGGKPEPILKRYGERGTANLRGEGEEYIARSSYGADRRVSQGLEGTIEEAIKDGVNKNQVRIRELADIARKTSVYEDTVERIERERRRRESDYVSIAGNEEEVEGIRSDIATLKQAEQNPAVSEERRETLKKNREKLEELLERQEAKLQTQREEVNTEARKRLVGKELKEEKVAGVEVGRSKITEEDFATISNRVATRDVSAELESKQQTQSAESEIDRQKLLYYQQYKEQAEKFRQGLLEEFNVIRQETLAGNTGKAQEHFNKLKEGLGISDTNVRTIADLQEKVKSMGVEDIPAYIVKRVEELNEKGGEVSAASQNVEDEGVITYKSEEGKTGADAIISLLKKGKEAGTLDTTQADAIRLASIARKTKVYEMALNKYEEEKKKEAASRGEDYRTLAELRQDIKDAEAETFESSEVGKKDYKNEEERKKARDDWDRQRKVNIASYQESIDKITEEFKNNVVRNNVRGTKIAASLNYGGTGVNLGADVIRSEDIPIIEDLMSGRNFETKLGSKDYNARLQAAWALNAKNIRKLEEIFETTDYGEIKGYADKLGLGEIADPANAAKLTERLEHAKVLSQTGNRTISSVLNEQSTIVAYLRELFGGKENISQDMIMGIQDIGELAEASRRERGGIGPTRSQATAGAIKAIGGFLDRQGSAYTMATYALNHSDAISLSDEGRERLQGLVDKVRNANTYEDKESALREVQLAVQNMGLMNLYKYVQAAGAEGGLDIAEQRSGVTLSHNLLTYFQDMDLEAGNLRFQDEQSREFFRKLKSGGKGSQEATQMIQDIFGTNGVDREIMAATVEDIDTDRAEALIEDQKRTMRSQGMSEEDIAKSEKNLRAWLSSGRDMRKLLLATVDNEQAGASYTTNSQQARVRSRKMEEAYKELLNPEAPEGTKQGMVKDFFKGMLEGLSGKQWSEKETAGREVAEAIQEGKQEEIAYDETGQLTEKGVEYLNSKVNETGMLVMDITDETGEQALKNKDILSRTITGPGGEAIPLWKAMNYTSLEEAEQKAHGQSLLEGIRNLQTRYGQNATALGDNRHLAIQQHFQMRHRQSAYNIESRQLQRQEDIRELLKDKFGAQNVEFDKNGNISLIETSEGGEVTGKDLQVYLDEAKKDDDVRRLLSSNTGEDGSDFREVADLVGRGRAVNFSQGVAKTKNSWDKLSQEEQAEWGNKANFDLHRIMINNLEATYGTMSDTEKASAMTEFNRLAQNDATLEKWRRGEDESNEDYWKRIQKGPREVLAQALRGVHFDGANSQSFQVSEQLMKYLDDEYTTATGEQPLTTYTVKDGKVIKTGTENINMDEVKTGSMGDSNLGGGTGVLALGNQIMGILTQIFSKLNNIAPGNVVNSNLANQNG